MGNQPKRASIADLQLLSEELTAALGYPVIAVIGPDQTSTNFVSESTLTLTGCPKRTTTSYYCVYERELLLSIYLGDHLAFRAVTFEPGVDVISSKIAECPAYEDVSVGELTPE
jgi:hypothetical protein